MRTTYSEVPCRKQTNFTSIVTKPDANNNETNSIGRICLGTLWRHLRAKINEIVHLRYLRFYWELSERMSYTFRSCSEVSPAPRLLVYLFATTNFMKVLKRRKWTFSCITCNINIEVEFVVAPKTRKVNNDNERDFSGALCWQYERIRSFADTKNTSCVEIFQVWSSR